MCGLVEWRNSLARPAVVAVTLVVLAMAASVLAEEALVWLEGPSGSDSQVVVRHSGIFDIPAGWPASVVGLSCGGGRRPIPKHCAPGRVQFSIQIVHPPRVYKS